MIKYTKPTLLKIAQLFKCLEYSVRYEKGNFNSGYCLVENSKIVVVNKFFETEGRVNVLLDIMEIIDFDEDLLDDKNKLFFKTLIKNRYSSDSNDVS
jgi:hypothetical protein